MNPLISVITSYYNEPDNWLQESINSILKQSFKDFELLIVADLPENKKGISLLKGYRDKDKRIKLIINEKNIGLTRSLNKAIKLAKGKYIARLDSDDIAFPDRLEFQKDFMNNHPDVFLIGNRMLEINANGKILRKSKSYSNPEKLKKKLTQSGNAIYHSSILFRNKDINYRDKFRYSQDYDLYLRLLSGGEKIINHSKIIGACRINDQSISQQQTVAQQLYADTARYFYQQRIETGQDDYDQFDPLQSIHNAPCHLDSPSILRSFILKYFKKKEYYRCLIFTKAYLKSEGIKNKFLIYYFWIICQRFKQKLKRSVRI